jgi:hypothetical protein
MPALLNPWAIYEHPLIAWDAHPAQEVVLESDARHKVWCAGRRTGKSELGGHVLLPEAIYTRSVAEEWRKKGKSRIFWIVSDEYATAEKEFRVIWHLCQTLELPLDKPGSYYDAVGGNMHISLWNGAFQIHAQSAKYPEHLVGEALCGVIMAEAAKAKPSIWHRFIRPMLNDYKGWSLHTSTPLGHNHFYDKFQMGQDTFNPDWESWRVPSWYNHYVYTETGSKISAGILPPDTPIPEEELTRDADVKKLLMTLDSSPGLSSFEIAAEFNLNINGEILQLLEEMPRDLFNQEIAADFTEFVGQVFKDFDEAYHVGDLRFNPDWETYAATDYGFTNPNVWLLIQVGPWQEINVLAEVYETNLTADKFAEEIKRRGLNPPQLQVFYPDPADPMSSRALQDKLRVMPMAKTGGELNIRLNLIRQALRKGRIDKHGNPLTEENSDIWRPQLMFDRRGCPRTRADMLAYRYPELKEESETSRERFELPMKKDDHGPEALGRFMVGYFGDGNLLDFGTRITKASMGRSTKKRRSMFKRDKPIKSMIPTKSGYPDWREWQ